MVLEDKWRTRDFGGKLLKGKRWQKSSYPVTVSRLTGKMEHSPRVRLEVQHLFVARAFAFLDHALSNPPHQRMEPNGRFHKYSPRH